MIYCRSQSCVSYPLWGILPLPEASICLSVCPGRQLVFCVGWYCVTIRTQSDSMHIYIPQIGYVWNAEEFWICDHWPLSSCLFVGQFVMRRVPVFSEWYFCYFSNRQNLMFKCSHVMLFMGMKKASAERQYLDKYLEVVWPWTYKTHFYSLPGNICVLVKH